MSRLDPKVLYDGISALTKGVNSGLAPISVPRDQLAWAVNCQTRNNYLTSRPGWVKRPLTFENGTTQTNFQTAIFEGASLFQRSNQIVAMIGGHLFRITSDTWQVSDVSTPGDYNPSNRYRAWFAEAEDWLICQDGISIPWIYDGASTKRSDTLGVGGKAQVPIGQAMVYSQGRLIVCYSDGRQFVCGDIVGGDSGTAAYGFRDAVLYFTENDIINGGGAFAVPINSGPLTALRPIAQVDTSTGQGPTQVFTTGGIFSLNTPTNRTQWATTNFPIGTVSMIQSGALSDRDVINVNGDLWFRAIDGVRSFIVARRDYAYTWVNAPMSQEVTRAIALDDQTLLGYTASAIFDNRRLMTCRPTRVWSHGIVHAGLAVIDYAPVAYLNNRANPVWEGLWTGLRILQVVSATLKNIERCFIFALNGDNVIELWEVTKDAAADTNGSTETPITWLFETGALTFPRGGDPNLPGRELQSLDGGRLYVDDMQGSIDFDLFYHADQDPCWRTWHSWSVCATLQTCNGEGCFVPGNYRVQYRKPFNLPQPTETCDPVVNKTLNWGREFQVRGVISGKCRIKMLECVAHDQQENVTGLCAPDETCASLSCANCYNDFAYTIA